METTSTAVTVASHSHVITSACRVLFISHTVYFIFGNIYHILIIMLPGVHHVTCDCNIQCLFQIAFDLFVNDDELFLLCYVCDDLLLV